MIWFIILEEILLFIVGMRLINKNDGEAAIKVSLKEYVAMGLIFVMTGIGLFSCYGYGREFGCHSLLLYYLIFAAFIDHKTQKIYRIGSIGFILLSMLIFLFVKGMIWYERMERMLWIMIFSVVSIMQGTLGWMGWGDVLTYIGVFFSLGTWRYSCMTVELLAVYMLLANLIFLISNIRNFDWKRKRMKGDEAFLPGMAGAIILIELVMQNMKWNGGSI